MSSQLSDAHERVYQLLFRYPLPHNLQWSEVWSMLGSMQDAKTTEETNGSLKVVRNGRTLELRRARGKELADKRELMQIRHFLERSEGALPGTAPAGRQADRDPSHR